MRRHNERITKIYISLLFLLKKKLEQFKVFVVVMSRLQISFLGSTYIVNIRSVIWRALIHLIHQVILIILLFLIILKKH